MSELKEKCAVAGYVGDSPEVYASTEVYDMLYALQHRGAEASGIASTDSRGVGFAEHRGPGLVRDVFHEEAMTRLTGNIAIGQNRYSTDGARDRHLQPVIDRRIGFAMGTNGNLPVTDYLRKFLEKNHIRTTELNDSEMKALTIAQHLRNGHDLPDAVELATQLYRGSYSTLAMHDGMVVAFRDPKGIRPFEFGKRADGEYFVASETAGLDIVGAEHQRSVKPGEMLIITADGVESTFFAEGDEKLDIFEFVYFARPDSKLYGRSVGTARRESGKRLAAEHAVLGELPYDNTLVVPVPDTARQAAEGVSEVFGFKLSDAIVKNRYIGRSFMLPGQVTRAQHLRRKHSFDEDVIRGKDLIMVDDSLVRMNTAPRLVAQAKQLGARSVSLLLASPPVRFPDFYGIDTPSQSELAAANMTVEQMKKEMGVSYLGFLSLEGLVAATGMPYERLNLSCFNGDYPIGIGKHKDQIQMPADMSYVE